MVMLSPTSVLLKRAARHHSHATKRQFKSLGLSVHFKHPDFGMKEYEILSRASSFLLAIDPPTPRSLPAGSGKYGHLDQSEEKKKERKFQQKYPYTPAGGPSRHVHELGWLEFCPSECRPTVHCLASSHVLAPWNWKNYYPHEWLQQVSLEHCTYSLEVFDTERPFEEALAKFALNPYPIHDDRGLDLAMLHLKQEDEALKHLTDLGVEVLRLSNKQLSKGEEIVFDGFEITDLPGLNPADKESSDDTRVFVPFVETGTVLFADGTTERSLAKTDRILPEGLCGGPALDGEGRVCGIVEGVVPSTHEQQMIAGATCLLSVKAIKDFLNMAEKYMLEQLVPKHLFRRVADMKAGNWMVGKQQVPDEVSAVDEDEDADEPVLDEMWQRMVSQLKENCSEREVNAVLATIRRETDEVLDILERDGGDMDDAIEQVHSRTMAARQMLMEQLEKDPEERQRIINEMSHLDVDSSTSSIPKAETEEKSEKQA